MLGGLVVALRRGRAPAGAVAGAQPSPGIPAPSDAERLAREIAALDDAHERAGGSGDDRGAYARRRAALKRDLADALAREGRRR
jgi:hypothetical protein